VSCGLSDQSHLSPWQIGHTERLIGSIRREYLDLAARPILGGLHHRYRQM